MNERKRVPLLGRWLLAACGLAGAILLATAMRLTPDGRGFGTHEQLGMASCWFMGRTGWPCPSCGMTTAWAHAVRGDVVAAAAANAGGALACVLAMAAVPLALASALTGVSVARWLPLRAAVWIGGACLAVTLLDWARRLASG